VRLFIDNLSAMVNGERITEHVRDNPIKAIHVLSHCGDGDRDAGRGAACA
jgi:hypothetical protein